MAGFLLPLIPVLLGLAALWAGATLALGGASRMQWRPSAIRRGLGVFVSGVGTILPEFWIALATALMLSATAGWGGLVAGTVVGSVLARVTLVLGGAILLGTLRPGRVPLDVASPILLAATGAVIWMGWDGTLGRTDGMIMLAGWLTHHVWRHRRAYAHAPEGTPPSKSPVSGGPRVSDGVVIVTGLAILAVGAWWVAASGLALSETWGTDPLVVGLLLLGIGASLPELVLSVNAGAGGPTEVSSVSVLRSGTVGLLLPLGAASVATPLELPPGTAMVDLPVLAFIVAVLWGYARMRRPLGRAGGVLLLGCFLGYALARLIVV